MLKVINTILTIFLVFSGTAVLSGSRLDYNAETTSLDLGTWNNAAVGVSYGLSYQNTLDSNLIVGGNFSYGEISTALTEHTVMSYGLGLGYMFTNSLDTRAGQGASFEIGSIFNTTKISGDGTDLSDNSTNVFLRAEMALAPSTVLDLTIGSPYDDLGNTLSSSIGVNFDIGGMELKVAYLSSKSSLEGVSANTSGFRLGWVTRFD